MTSTVKLLTQGDTAKLITSIAERGASLQADVHQASCSTLDHARVHGDWTGIVNLMNAMPNGQRVKALAFWYGHFSNGKVSLSIDKETKSWKVNKDRFASRAKDGSDFDVDAACETTFADLTVEKDPTPLTLARFIKSLSRTSVNADKFDGTDIDKVDPAARAVASKLLALAKTLPEVQALDA